MDRQITLLSKTDAHGIIVFANDAFCNVSKYSRNELIGRSHNIVRHPDMPKRLFEIFWETIQKGEIFRGIIKNMAKDSSHYWVKATIMPVMDEEKHIIRYIGARYLIEDDELAKDLFAQQSRAWGL
jgi:methyl-accepting chemotaxis protein